MALLTPYWVADLLIVLGVVILYFKYKFGYWNRKGVTSFPTTIPFGNAGEVMMQRRGFDVEFTKLYESIKRKGLGYAGYFFLTKPIFVAIEPDLIKDMLTKNFKHFHHHGFYINEEVGFAIFQ